MSLAHIRLKKVKEDDKDVVYAVLSFDFNDAHEWEQIAEVVVSRTQGTHIFSLRNAWLGEKVVPPYVYGLSEEERQSVLSSKFAGHGYGAWTGRILLQVRRMQDAGYFPDESP